MVNSTIILYDIYLPRIKPIANNVLSHFSLTIRHVSVLFYYIKGSVGMTWRLQDHYLVTDKPTHKMIYKQNIKKNIITISSVWYK